MSEPIPPLLQPAAAPPAPKTSHHRRIGGGAARLFLGTFASRILGFVLSILIARYFGARADVDIYIVALMVPNLFRGMLAEQAIESAFLPTFKTMLARGQAPAAWHTASVVLNRLLIALLIVVILCLIFAPFLVGDLFAPGLSPDQTHQAANLGRIMAPYMLLIGLTAYFGSLLLAHNQYLAYGLAHTLYNLAAIATILLFWNTWGIYSLAAGVLIGGLLELLGAALPLTWGRRQGHVHGRLHLAAGLADPAANTIAKLAIPVTIAAAVSRCDFIVGRYIASYLQEGSIAAINNALQIALIPTALLGLSIGRAALVPLSEYAAHNNAHDFQRALGYTIRLTLFLLIPLSIATALLAHPIIALVFQRGKFGPSETDMATAALIAFAPGLAALSLISILSRAAYALKDTSAPLRASVRGLIINALVSAALAILLPFDIAHAAIAIGSTISALIQVAILMRAVRARIRTLGPIQPGQWFGRPFIHILLATTAMTLAILLLTHIPLPIQHPIILLRLLHLLIPATGGTLTYLLAILLLDRPLLLRALRRAA